MKSQSTLVLWFGGLLLSLSLASFLVVHAQNKRSNKYVCSETNPASICTASNRCGSASDPCVVDLKRKGRYFGYGYAVIPNSKSNAPFCVKTGTTVTWQSSAKNTGFILDFGPSSPFDTTDAIIGGSDRTDLSRRQTSRVLQVLAGGVHCRNHLRNVRIDGLGNCRYR